MKQQTRNTTQTPRIRQARRNGRLRTGVRAGARVLENEIVLGISGASAGGYGGPPKGGWG